MDPRKRPRQIGRQPDRDVRPRFGIGKGCTVDKHSSLVRSMTGMGPKLLAIGEPLLRAQDGVDPVNFRPPAVAEPAVASERVATPSSAKAAGPERASGLPCNTSFVEPCAAKPIRPPVRRRRPSRLQTPHSPVHRGYPRPLGDPCTGAVFGAAHLVLAGDTVRDAHTPVKTVAAEIEQRPPRHNRRRRIQHLCEFNFRDGSRYDNPNVRPGLRSLACRSSSVSTSTRPKCA